MAASCFRGSGTRLCPLVLKSSSKTRRLQLKFPQFCSRHIDPLHSKVLYQISAYRSYSASSVLREKSTATTHQDPKASSSSTVTGKTQSPPTIAKDDSVLREHYIPMTCQSTVRYLAEEKDFLTEEEKKLFPGFVHALDTALVVRYHGVLEELKELFDPCNPDKETLKSRQWTRKDKLDNEFSLLQLLEYVMSTANFYELSPTKVEDFLRDHETRERVRVRVDPLHYDVLRFWVLGHEVPSVQLSIADRILQQVLRRPPRKPEEYYKRVVVALRLKKDSKLILKAFKEVPVQGLEALLPDGSIHMRPIDKGVVAASAAVAGFGVLAKLATYLVSVNVDWTIAVSLVSGVLGLGVWTNYTDRRNAYLTNVARILYFKNIASNRCLLTLLVDRAEDESLKEALLAYVFLLNSQSLASRNKIDSLFVTLPPGGLTGEELESRVDKWLEKKTGAKTKFDSSEAVKTLKNLGIIREQNNKYHAIQLDAAARLLPQRPRSVIVRRATEADITEGYDRDQFLETESVYKAEDHKIRRYGWF